MLYQEICRILGFFLLGLALVLLIPAGIDAYYEYLAPPADHPQLHTTIYFLETIAISAGLGALMMLLGMESPGRFYRKEAIASVVLVWILIPAVGALPFLLSGTLANPLQAYFEIVSGMTTTGSTVMQAKEYNAAGQEVPIRRVISGVKDTEYVFYGTIEPVRDPQTGKIIYSGIEAVSKALLFWRSFVQWLGGMGVVVLFVAVLPALGVGGKVLFQSEITGPMKESITPRIKITALHLWAIYLLLSFIQTISLMTADSQMSWYDAITIAFSTLSTGGFSVRNLNIAAYNSPAAEWIVMLFMILGSINFSLYYFCLKGKFYRLYEPEFFLFCIIIAVVCLFSAWGIYGTENVSLTNQAQGFFSLTDSIRYGFFQVISALTSTGFVTTNYNISPLPVQTIMLISMFIGGMSGSTAGGIKIIRHYIMFKLTKYKVESVFRPQNVTILKVADREVDNSAALMVLCFFVMIIGTSTLGTLLYVMDHIDVETAIGLVGCMINNVGLGFRMDGPLDSCAFLSQFGLIVSSLLMILGRLEFYVVFALLIPAFWKEE